MGPSRRENFRKLASTPTFKISINSPLLLFDFLLQNLVAGVFADYDFGNVKGKFNVTDSPFVGSEEEKSFWSVGGRIGWLITPQILSYWSGGFTEAHFDGVTFVSAGAPRCLQC